MSNRRGLGNTRKGRLYIALIISIVAIGLVVGASAVAQAQSAEEEGEKLFQNKGCSTCHTIGGGAKVGPDLKGVTERMEDVKGFIRSPNPPMPVLGLSDGEIEAIVAYLGTSETAPATTPSLYVLTLTIGGLAVVGLTILGIWFGKKRVEVRP